MIQKNRPSFRRISVSQPGDDLFLSVEEGEH